MINRLGATHLDVWTIKHLASPFQRWVYRATSGKFLSAVGKDWHVLLLTTKGRRTGKDRTIPVFYLRHGKAIVICNVKPKFEQTNPWVINLRSNPVAKLQMRGDTAWYQAREATDNEIDLLWAQLIKLWPAFQTHYQRGGRRSIFLMERT